jgi:hypothetical protein
VGLWGKYFLHEDIKTFRSACDDCHREGTSRDQAKRTQCAILADPLCVDSIGLISGGVIENPTGSANVAARYDENEFRGIGTTNAAKVNQVVSGKLIRAEYLPDFQTRPSCYIRTEDEYR